VTSNDGRDEASYPEDFGTHTDQTFDDDYDNYYDDDGDERRKTDLVFHGLTQGLHGMTDRQLVEWVLGKGLSLDPSQYIQEIERFGMQRGNQVRPIRVRIQTLDKRRDVLRRAKTLRPQRDFRRIYIQPFLSRRQQQRSKELREVLREFRKGGRRSAKIVRNKSIVEFVNGRENVLYTAD